MEYLAVIGISLLLIIPLTTIWITQSQSFEEDINAAHMDRLSQEMIDSAEEVFYLGPPSQKRLRLYFPDHLKDITFETQAIVFDIQSGSSARKLVVDSPLHLNLSGTLKATPGPHTILVTATDTGVIISELS